MQTLRQLKTAVRLARKHHAGQVRKGPNSEPFYNHPRRVCKSYLRFRHKKLAGAVASLCHDLVEDTEIEIQDLGRAVGGEAQKLVMDLTKPRGLPSSVYGGSIKNWNPESKKIKLCDIEDNIVRSRDIESRLRMRMLTKWKNYLDQLAPVPGEDSEEEREYLYKWETVVDLCAREMRAMSPGL